MIDEYEICDSIAGIIEDPEKNICKRKVVVMKEGFVGNSEEIILKTNSDPEVLCASDISNLDSSFSLVTTCSSMYTLTEDIGDQDYIMYQCEMYNLGTRADPNEKAYCWEITSGTIKVCAESEANLCDNGIDDDCDGTIDYADSECVAPCICPGSDYCSPGPQEYTSSDTMCDHNSKSYCLPASDNVWSSSNAPLYCTLCSTYDSTCDGNICTAGQAECNGGCIPDTCDLNIRRFCSEDGLWISSNDDGESFCDKCGEYSASCGGISCDVGSCDTGNNAYCAPGGTWDSLNYCDNCYDPSCSDSCSLTGFPDICDTGSNNWCSNGVWNGNDDGTVSPDYCLTCGSIDSDCGVLSCTSGKCDYYTDRWCNAEGQWQSFDYADEYCLRCKADNYGSISCSDCTENPAGLDDDGNENQCHNGIDDNCDGFADCNDPNCKEIDESCLELCDDKGDIQTCAGNIYLNTNIASVGNYDSSCGVPTTGQADPGCCYLATQECDGDLWGTCTYNAGDLKPTIEICNSLDDNCDGSIDEGCECDEGEKRSCGDTTGTCGAGIQSCRNGYWGICEGGGFNLPVNEICGDGLDNNCNGKTDEGCSCDEGTNQTCGDDTGACQKGVQTCLNESWTECVGQIVATTEFCGDSIDNDCDGLTDDEDDTCPPPSTEPSATCFDASQNQGEEGIDCGGPCPPCEQSSCDDRKKNGEETGVDCGGSDCDACETGKKKVGDKKRPRKSDDTDEDGLADDVELESYGTDPDNPDTDEDGIWDGDDDYPLCPNGFCDEEWGEDAEGCPEDCGAGLPWLIIILFILILLLGSGGFALWKTGVIKPEMFEKLIKIKKSGKKDEKKEPVKEKAGLTAQPIQVSQTTKKSSQIKSKYKTREEEELEKSFKEADELFKKK